jgi:hypothetical protein
MQPDGSGFHAVEARDQLAKKAVRSGAADQPAERQAIFGQRAARCADPAAPRIAQQRLDARRAGNADAHRHIDPAAAHLLKPVQHPGGVEGELRDDLRIEAARAQRLDLGQHCFPQHRLGNIGMVIGMARDAHMGEAMAFQQPGLDDRKAVLEGAGGLGQIPRDQKERGDLRLRPQGAQQKVELIHAGDAPGREMRHRLQPLRANGAAGGDARLIMFVRQPGHEDLRRARQAKGQGGDGGGVLGRCFEAVIPEERDQMMHDWGRFVNRMKPACHRPGPLSSNRSRNNVVTVGMVRAEALRDQRARP